jgi:glutamate/tyrosine decarboxylase-like PLP-dependent enzyme
MKTELLNSAHILIEKYLGSTSDKVVNYKDASELNKILINNINEDGLDSKELLAEIQNILDYSVKTTHPRFNNQLFAAINEEAIIGEYISAATNTSMATYEIAPVASIIEKRLVSKMLFMTGFESGEGIMCTGGSNANLLAMLVSRCLKYPETKKKGNIHQFCVFTSDQAHYSFKKGINLMGLGSDSLVIVKSDKQGKMLAADLKDKIKTQKDLGKVPLILCLTAGTTVKGAVDDIEELTKIAHDNNMWSHVDGAWGGSIILSKKRAGLFKGLSSADSFAWDCHKTMGTGLISSFFLTKHRNALKQTNSGGGDTYIFHDYENSAYDSGPNSLQCGRKVDALKVWLSWLSLGDKAYSERIEKFYTLRDHFLGLIKKEPSTELLFDPMGLNVCFRFNDSLGDLNSYNKRIRDYLVKEANHLINYSTDNDTVFFRHIFANQNTTINDSEELFKELLKIKKIIKEKDKS